MFLIVFMCDPNFALNVGGLEGLEVAQPSLSAYLEVRSHLVQV